MTDEVIDFFPGWKGALERCPEAVDGGHRARHQELCSQGLVHPLVPPPRSHAASTRSGLCAPARLDLSAVAAVYLTWAGLGLHAGRRVPRPLEATRGLDLQHGPGEWMMHRRRSYTVFPFAGDKTFFSLHACNHMAWDFLYQAHFLDLMFSRFLYVAADGRISQSFVAETYFMVHLYSSFFIPAAVYGQVFPHGCKSLDFTHFYG
ncbi:uncharacterized protein LOC115900399 isoform X1 [Rhinopithecus roxellana]|uniref:uncharacterized protein LOC115900399 isoform X1 n=1 Tax=Rhinopithecus roxellana TaxID=61622 RepID=UPI00123746A7|nr:uncharacterized protein LOC115900399 isoform X1 [Rhinopithecus roxellana]XP_030796908.1 uncharacterized protein LOC115900399 isoform X1 [Rhinopithecus roxellana]